MKPKPSAALIAMWRGDWSASFSISTDSRKPRLTFTDAGKFPDKSASVSAVVTVTGQSDGQSGRSLFAAMCLLMEPPSTQRAALLSLSSDSIGFTIADSIGFTIADSIGFRGPRMHQGMCTALLEKSLTRLSSLTQISVKSSL